MLVEVVSTGVVNILESTVEVAGVFYIPKDNVPSTFSEWSRPVACIIEKTKEGFHIKILEWPFAGIIYPRVAFKGFSLLNTTTPIC